MPILVPNLGGNGSYEKVVIPPGVYNATLATLEVKQMPSVDDKSVLVPTLIWHFEIVGKTKTVTIEHWSGATASLGNEKSWSRRFYMALTGAPPPAVDGQTDLEELIGLGCKIRVDDHTTQKGEKVSKIKDAWSLKQDQDDQVF